MVEDEEEVMMVAQWCHYCFKCGECLCHGIRYPHSTKFVIEEAKVCPLCGAPQDAIKTEIHWGQVMIANKEVTFNYLLCICAHCDVMWRVSMEVPRTCHACESEYRVSSRLIHGSKRRDGLPLKKQL